MKIDAKMVKDTVLGESLFEAGYKDKILSETMGMIYTKSVHKPTQNCQEPPIFRSFISQIHSTVENVSCGKMDTESVKKKTQKTPRSANFYKSCAQYRWKCDLWR